MKPASEAATPLDRCFHAYGARTNTALRADISNSSLWDCWVPIQGTNHKLMPRAPTMAPQVLAA